MSKRLYPRTLDDEAIEELLEIVHESPNHVRPSMLTVLAKLVHRIRYKLTPEDMRAINNIKRSLG